MTGPRHAYILITLFLVMPPLWIVTQESPFPECINLEDGFDLHISEALGTSGMTFDPTDNTLWLVDCFDDQIQHVDRTGKQIDDGFSYSRNYIVEGIAYDTSDNTLWLACSARGNEYVYHYSKLGTQLDDGFSLVDIDATSPMGIAYDSSDDSIWILDYRDDVLYHFDAGTGEHLSDDIDMATIGCTKGRGAAFDRRDNTIWLADEDSLCVYHVNRRGELMNDSFSYGFISDDMKGAVTERKRPIVEGIALDISDGTFWLTCLFREWVYHIKLPNNHNGR